MTLVLRPARPTDAGQMGEILYAFERDTPWMPKEHSGAEAISFCGIMIDRGWVTVADCDGQILGFLARDGNEICALYVAAPARGQGVGTALLNHAKSNGTDLWLWTFQANTDAQRFYTREGFAETARTDGAENAEHLPDIHYAWSPQSDLNRVKTNSTGSQDT